MSIEWRGMSIRTLCYGDLCRYDPLLEGGMMIAEKNAILRRQSMELLKELTEILQRIIGSGDEQSLRRLRETIRALHESRCKAAGERH
jgi:hypothetical protein